MSVVREIITKGDVQHLRRLVALNHPNLVPIWKMHNLDSHSPTVEIVSTIVAPLVIVRTFCNFLSVSNRMKFILFEILFKLFHWAISPRKNSDLSLIIILIVSTLILMVTSDERSKKWQLKFSFYQISKGAPLGNLKEYVLDKRCRIGDIVTFLSQVASALHYLHVNHIVHGDLSAEHVNVLAPDKVSTWHYTTWEW